MRGVPSKTEHRRTQRKQRKTGRSHNSGGFVKQFPPDHEHQDDGGQVDDDQADVNGGRGLAENGHDDGISRVHALPGNFML